MPSFKKYFLLDPSVIFLNHGSFGATPRAVFNAYQRWQRELERQPVQFLGRQITGLLAESRAALGAYLGTQADNIVYTQNVTVALNIVAHSLRLGPGDEVLATEHEYGALDRTWRFLSKEKGFRYINQPVETPLLSAEKFVEDFWRGVTPRTRVIFMSHITSPTAVIFPVEEAVRRARQSGIITIIDGAHAPGQIKLRLDSLGADFYGGNLHKWLCAPKGAGFLYARPEVQSLLKPLVVSWGYEPEVPGVSAFIDQHEWWGTRDMAAFLSVPAAIEFQEQYNWDEVRESCHRLAAYAHHRICELTGLAPLHFPTDALRSNAGQAWFCQMVAAPLPANSDISLLKERLYKDYKIEIPLIEWKGRKWIRVSVQGYNTKRDIDALLRSLHMLLK
ncbi:MAG: aminotransferase class V-fold PLP-dependent enzyme [Chloroflexi bacterium]|nr:aminotransferase class V-fold PLP-dependent enzyme [Chloroflexota bacterium]